MHGPAVLKCGSSLQQSTDGQRKELTSTETLLMEEVNQLRSQVIDKSLTGKTCFSFDN
jgi:hypothetical protein